LWRALGVYTKALLLGQKAWIIVNLVLPKSALRSGLRSLDDSSKRRKLRKQLHVEGDGGRGTDLGQRQSVRVTD